MSQLPSECDIFQFPCTPVGAYSLNRTSMLKMVITQFIRLAVVGSLWLLPAAANTPSIDEARAAFEEGRFLEAADLAEALGTSGGYALAAQSLAVHGHYVAKEEDRTGFLKRAMDLGEAAVGADSTNPEAHYQSAHAVGRYAQSIGKFTALSQGLAGKIRRMLEATLEYHPEFAEAHVGLGGWHADIASAGPIARMMYGANRKSAVIHYERALELAPESKVVLMEYALRLPELDRRGGRARARELLSKAAALPVRDAHEEFIQQEIAEALEEVENEG